jgi:hypothetical protein
MKDLLIAVAGIVILSISSSLCLGLQILMVVSLLQWMGIL